MGCTDMPLDPEDKQVLDEILAIIHKEIKSLVEEHLSLFREEMRKHFPGPAWDEIQDRIGIARLQVKNDTFAWWHLEGVGLTGEQGRWKLRVLKSVVRGGIVGAILKSINSLLGSLSSALPILEAVKEYKEQVEASVENLGARRSRSCGLLDEERP